MIGIKKSNYSSPQMLVIVVDMENNLLAGVSATGSGGQTVGDPGATPINETLPSKSANWTNDDDGITW